MTLNSPWRVAVSEATQNKTLNPSAETTGNYAALAGTTVTRATTYQHYGLYSYRVETNADDEGMTLTLATLANATHFVTLRVRGSLPPAWDLSLDNVNYAAPRLIEPIGDGWQLFGLAFPADQANGSTVLYIRQNGAGAGDFYLDGIQVEQKSYWTTYCDGSQAGCDWAGPPNAATSIRSALSRAGGRLVDLYQEYGFFVEKVIGGGVPPQSLSVDSYAILPGGELNSVKTESRDFTIVGKFIAETEAELHANRQALIRLLQPGRRSPLLLRFSGARVQKDISAYYRGGLEVEAPVYYGQAEAGDDRWTSLHLFTERGAIQLLATDPYFYQVGESAVALDTNDSATFKIVAGRLKSTGQWDPLGPPAAGGTYTRIYAIGEDGEYTYFGGNFEDFNNIPGADYIARRNKQTGAWSALGTGFNLYPFSLIMAPDGTLIAGGYFTTADGNVANYVARWDGANWSPLGTGMNGYVRALVFGPDGTLYAGGNFTTADGNPANYVAKWDGANWTALGTGMNDIVYALAIGLDGTLYAGGQFTTADGANADYIAEWDGSAWSETGGGADNHIYALAVMPSTGVLYAGGRLTTAGTTAVGRIAAWNGTAWSALGSGVNNFVNAISIGSDGFVYASGQFTTAGGLSLPDRMARWNGYTWSHLDIDLPGSTIIYAFLASKYSDPVVASNYDIFVGYDTTGTGYFAGKVTAANDGSAEVYPVIVFTRSGGTSATITTLKNETTGQELLFNYALRDGESLTIDLDPAKKTIISSFDGPRMDAILPNCDFGTWNLQTGDNVVSSFVNVAGAPVITASMIWQEPFESYD
jgi:hypothetical protein